MVAFKTTATREDVIAFYKKSAAAAGLSFDSSGWNVAARMWCMAGFFAIISTPPGP